MKHAVLGVGAVGGLLAVALSSFGEEVIAVVRPGTSGAHAAGFALDRPTGAISAPVRVTSKLDEAADVLWIATKTFQLTTALESVSSTPRFIIPLLNGADHVAYLRERFGHDRVIPATIGVEAEKISAGRYLQKSQPVRLNIAARAETLLASIAAELTKLGFQCQFIANEQTLLWSKLCFLGPYALVTSASGMNNAEVAASPEWKARLDAAIKEACAVAKSNGAEVDLAKIYAFIAAAPPAMQSSMAKDVAAKRPVELDDIAAPILRGRERGIDVSTTEELVSIVRKKVTA